MIDINKQYQTASGHQVRIYATDGAGMKPVHGAYNTDYGWCIETWNENGVFFINLESSSLDLREVTPVYKYGTSPEAVKTQFNEEC